MRVFLSCLPDCVSDLPFSFLSLSCLFVYSFVFFLIAHPVCVCAETVLPLYPFSNQNLAPSTRCCSKFDRRTLFHSVAVLSLTSC